MSKLLDALRRRMMTHKHDDEAPMLKEIQAADVSQIGAILRTHAEMQDFRATQSMDLLARIKRDEPDETDMIDCLSEQIGVFEADSINLRRLAGIFGA